jgi:hypothetical protein
MGEIYAALAAAMSEVGAVGKTKKNLQQGYQFRGIDDVMAHLQPVLAKHGVVVLPEILERERETVQTKSGGTMASVRLLVKHTFYAKDGSSVAATTLGEAMDSGDKASNKAMSAALKYALTESLLVPTYEVERDTEESPPELAKDFASRAISSPPTGAPRNAVDAMAVRLNEAQTKADLDALVTDIKKLSLGEQSSLRPLFNKRQTEMTRPA